MNTQRLIESLEEAPIGDGDLRGEPFRVLGFQRRFLRGAFRPGVIRAGLSTGRGSGKTGLASALALDAIRPAGVLHAPGFETILIAASFQGARLAFEAVLVSLDLLGETEDYRIRDQQNLADIQHRRTGARLRVLGSDNKKSHGLRPNLVLADEPSMWGPSGELLASALRTALGKRRGAKAVFFGTRPNDSEHFFARLLTESDPSVFAQTHTAAPNDPPFQKRTWLKANPGLDFGLPNVDVLRAEARLAKRDPAELATFRALRLNMGTSEVETAHLISAEAWAEVETAHLPPPSGPMALGIDLGGTAAFSAAVAFWPVTGRLEGFVACGHDPPLAERERSDSVMGRYTAMLRAGELVQIGHRVVPVGPFLQEAVRRFGRPDAVSADRWRRGELLDGGAGLNLPAPVFRGMGWRDGAEDVRAFRSAVLEGRIAAPVSLALRSALSEARTISDVAANEKLAKLGEGGRRSRGRDDLAAAAILAVAEGTRRQAAAVRPRGGSFRYRGAVVT